MPFDHKIFHADGLDLGGRAYVRHAARAVILDGGSIMMIYSAAGDEYKFPGGGVEPGEAVEEALVREVMEEAGLAVDRIASRIGDVVEYDRAKEKRLDLFMMRSSYYLATVESGRFEQDLDEYESELGFTPRWVSVDEAIATNLATMASRAGKTARWMVRETWVLEWVRNAYAALLELAR